MLERTYVTCREHRIIVTCGGQWTASWRGLWQPGESKWGSQRRSAGRTALLTHGFPVSRCDFIVRNEGVLVAKQSQCCCTIWCSHCLIKSDHQAEVVLSDNNHPESSSMIQEIYHLDPGLISDIHHTICLRTLLSIGWAISRSSGI